MQDVPQVIIQRVEDEQEVEKLKFKENIIV
jgi:hypothetical protein